MSSSKACKDEGRIICVRSKEPFKVLTEKGQLTVDPLIVNMIKWSCDHHVLYKKDTYVMKNLFNETELCNGYFQKGPHIMFDAIRTFLRHKCTSKTNFLGFRTRNEIYTSPPGYVMVSSITNGKRNPFTCSLSSRGKLSNETAFIVITMENYTDEYPIKDEPPIEYMYKNSARKSYFEDSMELATSLGYKGMFLAETILYISKKGDVISIETTAVQCMNWFNELVAQLIEVSDMQGNKVVADFLYDNVKIILTNSSTKIHGEPLKDANIVDYLLYPVTWLPPKDAIFKLHDVFYDMNTQALEGICTKEEYMEIQTKDAIISANNSNQKIWTHTRVLGSDHSVALMVSGSVIIDGVKSFAELRRMWIHVLKIYVEVCTVGGFQHSDIESEGEDKSDAEAECFDDMI